jgi:hypothetical protein
LLLGSKSHSMIELKGIDYFWSPSDAFLSFKIWSFNLKYRIWLNYSSIMNDLTRRKSFEAKDDSIQIESPFSWKVITTSIKYNGLKYALRPESQKKHIPKFPNCLTFLLCLKNLRQIYPWLGILMS